MAAAIVLAAGSVSRAQATAPTPAEAPITLSPFTVSTTQDTSYAVAQTTSATRTATDIQSLPISISVVTDQFLSDLGAVDIQDALLYENVTTPQTAAYTSNIATTYIIRGFQAATMHDGFLAAGGSTPVATIAVDRVEVVKGPESLLYGEMDPGGLVNIVSKQPSSTPSTTVTASAGSYDAWGGSLDTTGPLSSDGRFSYRIMGDLNYANAITEGTGTERKEFVAMLAGQLSPNLSLNVEFDFAHHHVLQPGGEAYFVQLGVDPAGRGTQEQYITWGTDGTYGPWYNYRGPGTYGDGLERYLTAILQQHFGGWYGRLAYASLWDSTGSMYDKTGAPITTANASIAYTYNAGTSTTQSVQYDLTRTWKFAWVDWTFLAGLAGDTGVTWAESGNSTQSITKWTYLNPATWPVPWPPIAPPLSSFTTLNSDAGSVFHDGAIYTSDQFALLDNRLHILAGARYQRLVSTARNYTPPVSSQGFSENDTTYELGGLYQLTPVVGAYANWSQSFLPQNEILLNPKPVDPVTGLPVVGSTNTTFPAKPIVGEGHDLGFKFTFLNGKAIATAGYYDVREANQVQTREVTNPANGDIVDDYDVQSGAEWSQGVEFNLAGNPFPGVDVTVDYNQPFSGILLSDATTPTYVGKELQNNPKEQLGFFVKYTWLEGMLDGAFAGVGGRYWGDSQAFAPTQPQLATLPPYFLMQGLLGYRWKAGRRSYWAQLDVPNMLDRHVILSGYAYSGSTTWRLTLGASF